MPVYVYRIYPPPQSAFLSYYDWFEDSNAPAATVAGDGPTLVVLPYFTPGVVNPLWLANYYWQQNNETPQAAQEESTYTGWAKYVLTGPRALTLYLNAQAQDTPEAVQPETSPTWAPRYQQTPLQSGLRYYQTPAVDAPAPPAEETFARDGWVKYTFRPPDQLVIFWSQGNDASSVVTQPETNTHLVPRELFQPYRPEPALFYFQNTAQDFTFTPPPEDRGMRDWVGRPLWTALPNLRANSLYYFHETPGPEGESGSSQFLVFWQYRTQYEDRVRATQFLRWPEVPFESVPAQPETGQIWAPRFLAQVVYPQFWRRYWQTEQGFSFQFPEENPHWPPRGIQQIPLPRSVFQQLYYGKTAQDFTVAPEPPTFQTWTPRTVQSQYRNPLSQRHLYQNVEDVTGITTTSTGVGVTLIARVHGLEDQVFHINIIV